MKKTRFTCGTLAAVMLLSSVCSCNSSYQAAGGLTGAMIGGHVGEAVGYLSGHGRFRGENAALGSLIGMGVGALLGVGIASQIEEKEKNEAQRRYDEYEQQSRDNIGGMTENRNNRYGDYQIGGGAYEGASVHPSISISDLTYMDTDGDGFITKNETLEVEGYITNTSDEVLRDVVIYLTTNQPNMVAMSPSLTTNLQPGQKIRYTGRVHCRKGHKNQVLTLNLSTDYAGKTNTSSSLMVRMR